MSQPLDPIDQDSFNWLLNMEFNRAERYTHYFSVLPIKIQGNTVDDRLCVRIIQHISPILRCSDVFGSFGGDKIRIMLPHAETTMSNSIFQRILQRMATFYSERGQIDLKLEGEEDGDDPNPAGVPVK